MFLLISKASRSHVIYVRFVDKNFGLYNFADNKFYFQFKVDNIESKYSFISVFVLFVRFIVIGHKLFRNLYDDIKMYYGLIGDFFYYLCDLCELFEFPVVGETTGLFH